MPARGRSILGDVPVIYLRTAGYMPPKLNLLPCNLSLYYEVKLLTTTIHFFINFMSEGGLRAGEPSELVIIDYDGSTLG